ncbi:MAG TPA: lysylphosphatidylglycerol synthase transmembrane domain-containing protein [Ktedonobacteraceae bacterium]
MQHRAIRLSLQISITFGLLLTLCLSISWTTLFLALSHIHKSMLLVAVVVGAGGVVLSAYQWRGSLRAVRLYIDLTDLIKLYLVGIAFSHVLPTSLGGDAVKVLYVGYGDEERACSAGALLLCRISGFLAMLLIAVPALFIWRAQLNSMLCFWLCLLIGLIGGAISCAFLLFSLLHRFIGNYMQRSVWLKWLNPMRNSLCKPLWSPPALLHATASGWIFWWVAILNCYCYASSLGLVVPFYFFLIAVPFVALVSFVPVSLNGFGLREGAFVFAFTTIHISSTHALLLALLLDFQALCFAALGVSLYVTIGKGWRISSGLSHTGK